MTFDDAFENLTGHPPFPWQRRLYDSFENGNIPPSCNLPTGLGKTSVVAIWLVALANGAKVPRRLAYVVNRRTVVDQTTAEAERLRENLQKPELADLTERLQGLCASSCDTPLAISTLRGQFADNREWSADPSRPAVICGTVDMIGSRLLFSGYRLGFKSRPLHAGFLGQDTLLVHDEAHLEPAFQKLITDIEKEQTRERERGADLPWPKLHVMQLTATTRDSNSQEAQTFSLTPDDQEHPIIKERLKARKQLSLTSVEDDKQVANKIGEIAGDYRDANAAVLVFVRTLDAIGSVEKKLEKTGRSVVLLTGTMRGRERDELVEKPEFRRFLKGSETGNTVYLICTSAGEVGIDISADHAVCDLSTFESMAQRLGRVNRYGDGVARIDVVHPTVFGKIDKKTGTLKADEMNRRRQRTVDLLRKLPQIDVESKNGEALYDASPKALMDLRQRSDLPCKIEDAFSPEPTMLDATDILFDAWALTSIRQPMPGRPPVEPYLHGIAAWQPPETYVAWREEVEIITGELLDRHPPVDLLDDYPLKPHELLRDRSDRVFKHLESLAERHGEKPVWMLGERGALDVTALGKLVEILAQLKGRERDRRFDGCTILLPPSVGGLKGGMLDGTSKEADDVSDIDSSQAGARTRVWSDDREDESKTADMRRVRTIEIDTSEDEDAEHCRWEWYESIPLEGGRTAKKPVKLDTHTKDVENRAQRIVTGLSLPNEVAEAVLLAARLHDKGKEREQFQTMLGNRRYPDVLLAKAGRNGARLPESFRHEFASAADAANDAEVQKLSPLMQDLVLHLIATHHGRARPHFPTTERQAFDPCLSTEQAETLAIETPRRFARLQRRYGRWGLAYLESLLRAADWAASAEPSAYVEDKP